ncbi:GH92 family glycosyl hydrolase [Flammeovirga kamogawensis]|uniref:GH92 family glycosyl hydrolase n=1 Tax=Flammeovirga kamogawensis TaxID=373891 RepID=A0ABX8H3Y3_9BACT|nr:GH92 family glycosyl hydrolase [Flammeovirga kamogawensis]MBB6460313.1 putative alpha-1,2-mannosidase [Flammeovirga kamogawensis]QWG10122.1 GH92 family glycosyl hydrolase [Flammeovirga kamogawensis]TRX65631.1 glycoside hydrolase family 92 protein [Flammeovirga kamogawensis]
MKNFLLTSFNYLLIQLICTLNVVQAQNKDYTSFVNPFIGTQNMGHTYPGATTPFGMVQLSPETNQEAMLIDGKYNPATYAYCAGYQYADSTVFGFSHTHMSGTGHSDLGDFLVMPTTGPLKLNPGTADQPQSGYHSQFSHQTEEAIPGYYAVTLDDYNIKAELTTSDRVGYHKYTFPESDEAHIILDLISNIYNYDGKTVWTFVRVENDSTVTGYRQTNGWGKTRKVFFAMKFSKPFKSYGHKRYEEVKYNGFYRKFDQEHNFPEMAGEKIRAYFNFDTKENEAIEIKFALSSVSSAGAMRNLNTEVPEWNFNKVKNEAKEKWNNQLTKVDVQTLTEDQKITFYTALYHTMLSPVLYEDVDGQYRGLDQNIYTSDGFTNYTLFSLWDTYRALHPLFNVLHPTRNNDMIKSMLAHQEQSVHNMLPIWSHYANENWCMIGYHAVSVIADAMVKETTDVPPEKALNAALSTATVSYFDGIGEYIENGYVPADNNSASVSKTLEYAYDDFCISEIAKYAGKEGISSQFYYRSESFKNVFDSVSNYMRPKMLNGTWRKEFDPLDTHGQGFIEGNAWNYGLYVPHSVDEMITMMGGKEDFATHLDKIFTTPIEDRFIEKNEDITRDGIIGNYVHGNEPGHHIPYLYNWTNHPYKTQQRVRMIMDTMYTNERDGLCGNDDAGQMSAWYVFSALGFYPVLPGSAEYALGSPLVKEATIKFENGNILHILAKKQSEKNVYVKRVILNGVEIKGPTINHFDLMKGGELVFEMSKR